MKEARTGRKGSEIICVRYKAKVDHTLNAIAKTGGIRQAGIIDMKDRTTKDESGWTRPKEVRNKTRSDYTKLMLYTHQSELYELTFGWMGSYLPLCSHTSSWLNLS